MKRFLAVILIALATSAQAAEPAGVREAVNRVIAYEERADTTMRDAAFLAFFTPRFRAAVVKDMAGPEINVIDSDFLCQCQTGVAVMRILAITGSQNDAVVRIESKSIGMNPPVRTIWQLRRDGSAWRISDVETTRSTSLLADLERSNRLH